MVNSEINDVTFSIVTVIKDNLQTLKITRKSLEKQSFKNWIHIIIFGGDDRLISEYVTSLDKSNTLILIEEDSGIYQAMNKGWKLSQDSSYVFFLNSGDVFADIMSLQQAENALKSLDFPNWGCTTHEEISKDQNAWVCNLVSVPSIENQLYAFGYRSHQGIVMKKEFIKQLGGFNEGFKIAADWDLMAKAFLLEQPGEWIFPIGRFELGGFSSQNMLSAHLELKQIRANYLITTFPKKILDDFWCSIFLRYLGYKNYWSPFVFFLVPMIKDYLWFYRFQNYVSRFLLFGKEVMVTWLSIPLSFCRRSIAFKLIKKSLGVFFKKSPKPERTIIYKRKFRARKIFRKVRFSVIIFLHKRIGISGYTKPSIRKL